MPSLPPSSWRTTRMRPFLSGTAARAVRARNAGTVGARATSEARRRKSRRVNDMRMLLVGPLGLMGPTGLMGRKVSSQLRLGRCQDQHDGAAGRLGGELGLRAECGRDAVVRPGAGQQEGAA